MKTSLLLFLLIVPSFVVNGQSAAKMTAAEISFVFVSKDVDGTLTGFRSDSNLDLGNLANSTFKGSVDAATIKTGNFLRDWSLKGGKYFDADNHPRLSFESTSVTGTAEEFTVKGALTIKSVAKNISVNFKKQGDRLIGTATVYSSDFGIDIKKKREDNKVSVKMVFDIKR